MKELLEAGVHFGHQTKRWNPKMKKFIFGKRNGIYIIDLQKTLKLFKEASAFITDLSQGGKRILFVGTKRQAQDAILEEANRCGMFYVNNRWLGGTLTNFTTVRKSIERLKELESVLNDAEKIVLTGKKEEDKIYRSHSLYPGGLKSKAARFVRAEKPESMIEEAVWGMLPKNKIGRKMLKKLKVYRGTNHPHAAQKPERLNPAE